ncbi:oligosaccharide flippase family protein [Enterococcus casseliflavus]|uniref:oligosaccharide flippase family protein n=1 Tax=Enterococcus casseliflavus TaxID=37734 RepID=UPI001883AF10|nr:oligosaccharide flippase family protein [Enterococcus casseliflavus]MBE9900345.1 oligosaccharide flippase family protein [Enterococcus casseliflavus]MBE9903630.1 oligosaccharide flippase family protein [Enterococcus casseliflavus]MBE9923998.1 oligosaccharide flippase family protein [Enterococcus casseliflavus]
MKNSVLDMLKNFSYTFTSNLVSLIISSLIVLVIPKVIGVEEYGYWQLYLFYTSYVGFLHFGWNDGIYLRYGGEKYDSLDKNLFFSQFWSLGVFQLFLGLLIFFLGNIFNENINDKILLISFSINLIIVNVRYFISYLLQATNRLKEFAFSTILDRVLFLFIIITLLVLSKIGFEQMIIADLISKSVSFTYLIFKCNDIIIRNFKNFRFSLNESIKSISVGIKLMFANIASNLILGIIKFGIQFTWSVATFGKISLTLSISNLIMTFINALSLAIFPILRRLKKDKMIALYTIFRTLLTITLLGLVLIYYPLNAILAAWLPKYQDSLKFMVLVFPMIVFESKVSLLTNTYLKTIREEKMILKVNLISVLISLLLTVISTLLIKSITAAMLSIVIVLGLRSILAELELSKKINITYKKDLILEILMVTFFIFSGWYFNTLSGFLIYGIVYLGYLLFRKSDIKGVIQLLKLKN